MDSGIDLSAEELKVFLQEADEQIELLNDDIVRLEKDGTDAELLQEIFRAAHTLKGSSAMIGFQQMAELAHAMEDVLDPVRKHILPVTPELVDVLLRCLDALAALKEDLSQGAGSSTDVRSLVEALRSAAAASSEALEESSRSGVLFAPDPLAEADAAGALEAGLDVYRVEATLGATDWAAVRLFQVLQQLDEAGRVIRSEPSQGEIERGETKAELRALLATGHPPEEIRALVESVPDVSSVTIDGWRPRGDRSAEAAAPGGVPDARGSPAEGPAPKGEAQSMRIDVRRLDTLMNMVGELVIDRTRIGQISRQLQARYHEDELVQQLGITASHVVKVVDELNESAMQIRMLPIDLLFGRFPRMVRDLARASGKSIDFAVQGGETEIDRSVIEKVKDPLVHLLRNAVDHGIETPEVRAAAGKSLPAAIVLSARHGQGYIEIEVSDDGKGIDVDSLRQSAVRRQLLKPEVAQRLTTAEAVDLIFEPGLSTAAVATEVSGRGVGMDVVKKGITSLGGQIRVETAPGRGTTFTLRLPLTLATFHGLLVFAGAAYAIPLSHVQETVKLSPGLVERVMGREVLNLRGSVMPLMRINTLWGNSSPARPERFVVVLRSGERRLALAVDDLLDQQEVVVKPLGDHAGRPWGIAGASILGDGQVALIVEVPSLFEATLPGHAGAAQREEIAA